LANVDAEESVSRIAGAYKDSTWPAGISPQGPLRILHVLPFFSYGGTELVVRRLITSLDAPEFEHCVCAMRGFDPALVRAAQFETRIFKVGDPSERFQFPLVRLVRIMRRLRPHIVHTRNWGALEAILAARLAGVPATVHSEHGYDLDSIAGLPWRRRLIRRGLYSLTDVLFTVSKELQEFHAKQTSISAGRIRVLYNGVDTERFAFRSESRIEARAELGIPSESMVVGSVGRMVAIKDHRLILEAVSLLIQGGHDVRALLVGAGPELGHLQQRVRDSVELNGRVYFCGFSDRVPDFLNAMDIFVQSSRAEGMSNTLLEAMATGLPLLATRVGGNSEVIADGESGYLFQTGDCADLVYHLSYLINSLELRCQLGRASRRRALRKFSVHRMVQEYRNLYRELALTRGIFLPCKA
jgi:sugar transferase (PEP-CTERM/EpsH1 system associated)